jgi:hypothetical protein
MKCLILFLSHSLPLFPLVLMQFMIPRLWQPAEHASSFSFAAA